MVARCERYMNCSLVLLVRGGSGRPGKWTCEGQIGRINMVSVVCLINSERLDPLPEAAFAIVENHIGVLSIHSLV